MEKKIQQDKSNYGGSADDRDVALVSNRSRLVRVDVIRPGTIKNGDN